MNQKQSAVFWIVALLSLISPLFPQARSSKDSQRAGDKRKIDACALLTTSEVQDAQGEPVQEAKLGTDKMAALQMTQCLYRTVTPAKSVSIALAAPGPDPASTLTPRQFWRRQFHDAEHEVQAEDEPPAGKKVNREESARPRAIAGIGDEAFWVGSSISGALYVLKGEAFLRISVGGVRDEATRIAKSRTLALAAVKRL